MPNRSASSARYRPRAGGVRAARRAASQYLHQFADLARSVAAADRTTGLRFAGQITGCEGYVESAAMGLLAGRFAAAARRGDQPSIPSPGDHRVRRAPQSHHRRSHRVGRRTRKRSFQPMNVNFGLFPPLEPGTNLRPTISRGVSAARTRPWRGGRRSQAVPFPTAGRGWICRSARPRPNSSPSGCITPQRDRPVRQAGLAGFARLRRT